MHWMRFLAATGFSVCFLLAPSQSAQTPPVPDELAYTVIFHVIRSAPPPHWDHETCQQWLMDRGVERKYAQRLIRVADRYFQVHQQVEAELAAFNGRTRNSLAPEAQSERNRIEQKRAGAMREAIQSLRLEMDTLRAQQSVSDLLTEVKRSIKIKAN